MRVLRFYGLLHQSCQLKQKLFQKIYSERSRTMKKLTKELTSKTVKELEKLIQTLREEIAKLVLNKKVNPSKDTNLLRKKRKSLAVMLAVLTQKKELEAIKSK